MACSFYCHSGLILALVLAFTSSTTECHKILLYPFGFQFNSHILDMVRMSEILKDAGHDVHFLISSSSVEVVEKAECQAHVYDTGDSNPELATETMKELYLNESGEGGFKMLVVLKEIDDISCRSLLSNRKLVNDVLREEKFDLVIGDLTEFCWSPLANTLNVPVITYLPMGFMNHILIPNFFSFMPTLASKSWTNMNFQQRMVNLIENIAMQAIGRLYAFTDISKMAKKFNTSFDPEFLHKNVMMIRANPALDAPYPTMPNVIDIGGALLKPSSRLPKDLEEFMTGAGEAGVIIVSFGTLVADIPDDRGEILARVFSRLKQRVLWKYTGELKYLGTNTRLVRWLPQNDLLGHPQTKLFITHCGMSSTFEAVYHKVPVVTFPLFGDQFQNSHKLVTRLGMGVKIDFHHLMENELEANIREVLDNYKYQANAKRASELMLDQPVHPREKFLFYVDHVVKTGGAKHLIQERVYELNFLQLHSIDTCLCLLTMSALVMLITIMFTLNVVRLFKRKIKYFAGRKRHEHPE